MNLRDVAFLNMRRRKAKAAFVLVGLMIGVATVVADHAVPVGEPQHPAQDGEVRSQHPGVAQERDLVAELRRHLPGRGLLGDPGDPEVGRGPHCHHGEVRGEIIDYAIDNDPIFRSLYSDMDSIFPELPEETQALVGYALQRYLQKYSSNPDVLDEIGLVDDNLDKSILDEEIDYVTERTTTQDEPVGIANS